MTKRPGIGLYSKEIRGKSMENEWLLQQGTFLAHLIDRLEIQLKKFPVDTRLGNISPIFMVLGQDCSITFFHKDIGLAFASLCAVSNFSIKIQSPSLSWLMDTTYLLSLLRNLKVYQRKECRLHFCCQSIHALLHIGPEITCIGPGTCSSQWCMERTIGILGQEFRQPSNPYQNLSECGLRRAQINAFENIMQNPHTLLGYPIILAMDICF